MDNIIENLPENIQRKLIALIKKRDNLLEIGSLEEANTFAAKVTEILLKYNLEESSVNVGEKSKLEIDTLQMSDFNWSKNEAEWMSILITVLAKYNMCMAIRNKIRFAGVSLAPRINLVGSKLNREIVIYLFDQLTTNLRYLEKQAWKDVEHFSPEKRNTFKRGYFKGAIIGITTQLENQKKHIEESIPGVGLMVLNNDTEISLYVKSSFGEIKNTQHKRVKSQLGKEIGYKHGLEIKMNKGLGSDKTTSKIEN